MEKNDLTGMQLDVLKEIGNIGAGNAVTSISKLLNKKINMQIPSVNMVSFDEVMDMVGGPETIVTAVYFRFVGDLQGTIYFTFTVEEAEYLIRQVTGTPYRLAVGEQPDEIAVSALKEIGNILAGSYLSALSDFISMNIKPSVPIMNIDMAGAILITGLYELSQVSDYAIIIDAEMNDGMDGMNGHLFLMPEPESLSKIFSALGAEENE